MIRERDIVYQVGDFWVLQNRDNYEVRRDVGTHSISDGAYRMSADGLSLAKARVDYLAKRADKVRALPSVPSWEKKQ